MSSKGSASESLDQSSSRMSQSRLPDDAPNRWVDPSCSYCKPAAPCLMHDRRPKTLAQNRVIFGPSFGYEPTTDDRKEADVEWA